MPDVYTQSPPAPHQQNNRKPRLTRPPGAAYFTHMANLSLSQLREAQKANPPHLDEYGERIVEMARQKLLDPSWSPPAAAAGPSPEGSLPLQASPTVPAAASGGYCRIFPATYPTAADIPEDWKALNWGADPSPWQLLEGRPTHPEFEANLAALEQAVCD